MVYMVLLSRWADGVEAGCDLSMDGCNDSSEKTNLLTSSSSRGCGAHGQLPPGVRRGVRSSPGQALFSVWLHDLLLSDFLRMFRASN
jgi:hypothetical protein